MQVASNYIVTLRNMKCKHCLPRQIIRCSANVQNFDCPLWFLVLTSCFYRHHLRQHIDGDGDDGDRFITKRVGFSKRRRYDGCE